MRLPFQSEETRSFRNVNIGTTPVVLTIHVAEPCNVFLTKRTVMCPTRYTKKGGNFEDLVIDIFA